MSAGSERNAPCPCGSGRKYKKCHGREATESPEMAAAAEFHRYGQELVPKLYRYADRQLGIDLIEILAPMITDEAQVPFWGAIQLFHEEIDEQPVVDWVLADATFRLTPIERAVLEAEREAWLSVWEVVSVAPGTSVVVRDLLTGVERTATDTLASTTLVPHDGILGRVATYRGVHVFTGLYPNALPPMETARVVDEMRRKLRRKGDIPVERLRPIKIVAHLVEWWETVVELRFARANHLPDLRNTDGDDLLLTTDHFAVREEDRSALRACVAAMPDVDAPPPDAPEEEEFIFLSSSQGAGLPTIIGVLRPNRAGVALETNSIERADRLRAALEQHAGSLMRHRIREHPSHTADPRASHPQAELPDADRDAIIADFLARYYREWLDTPVPALDNQTPRAAVKSRDGRRQVEALLAEFEHRGLMGGVGPQPDVAALRRELGL